MASTTQRRNSEDTLKEEDMSNVPNHTPEDIASSTVEGKSLETQADNASPDLEAQNQPEKRKLPSIFSPQLKKDRMTLLKAIVKIEILLTVIVLGTLSLYWGGLASIEPNQRVLTIAIVDFDGQEVGNAFTSAGILLLPNCSDG